MATVYVAMICDRHTDPKPHLFSTADAAIAFARRIATEGLLVGEVDETPIAGWLYHGRYSPEGDRVWVVARKVDADPVEVRTRTGGVVPGDTLAWVGEGDRDCGLLPGSALRVSATALGAEPLLEWAHDGTGEIVRLNWPPYGALTIAPEPPTAPAEIAQDAPGGAAGGSGEGGGSDGAGGAL